MQRINGTTFPSGTLAVNVLGSFVVGFVMALSVERGLVGGNLRTFLAVGFCGGFTTMSTFSYETMALLQDGERLLAAGNLGLTLLACFGAVWLGTVASRLV